MGAEEAEEAGQVVQGLEPVDVLRLHQVLVAGRHAQEYGCHLRVVQVTPAQAVCSKHLTSS